jgi:prophage antirepressor-like protein/very-short-patch-repair endonuclease
MVNFVFDVDHHCIKCDEKIVRLLLVGEVGSPWFYGNDVANLVGYKDCKKAVTTHVARHCIRTTKELSNFGPVVGLLSENKNVKRTHYIDKAGFIQLTAKSESSIIREIVDWILAGGVEKSCDLSLRTPLSPVVQSFKKRKLLSAELCSDDMVDEAVAKVTQAEVHSIGKVDEAVAKVTQAEVHSIKKVDEVSSSALHLVSDCSADDLELFPITVETVEFGGVCYYRGNDLARMLGYQDPKHAVKTHVPTESKVRGIDIGLTGSMNRLKSKYVTSSGASSLVYRSRLPYSLDIARIIGMPISVKYKAYYHEMSTINAIMAAFKSTRMLYQHTVDKHRVDLYFPDYRLAIECDENNHKAYDGAKEILRQQFITNTLGVSWIRYDPDEKDFNILSVINKVHKHIINFS